MGLISKILGGLFSFLGGILKIFGIGKSTYYVEMPDAPPSQPADEAPAPAAAEPAKAESTPAPASQPAAPAPTPVASSVASAPAIVQPEPVPGLTFAPNFLVLPSTSSRRRPGPSLSSFLSMAQQVKTR